MADKKTGPVKPPIIDAKARETGGADDAKLRTETASSTAQSNVGEPEKPPRASTASASRAAASAATATPRADTAKPKNDSTGSGAKAEPPPPAVIGAGGLVVTGLGGAALGLAVAYGLAAFGFWPTPGPDTDPAALETRLASLEAAVSSTATASTETSARVDDFDERLQALESGISAFGDADPVARSDFDALSARVDELASALGAVSAGTSGAEATQIGADIAALQSRIDAAEGDLGALIPAADTMTGELQTLEARVAELESALADQPEVAEITAERDRFAQIPAMIATLERQIAAGAPFAAALANLEAVLPDLAIPEPVRAASVSGIASTDTIGAELRTLMPDLLAARPQDPNAGILETLMSQAQSAVALRPVGEVTGDTPDALLARAEAALENGDMARAGGALAALPGPMQSVAAPIIDKIVAALAAQDVLDAARNAGNGETAQ